MAGRRVLEVTVIGDTSSLRRHLGLARSEVNRFDRSVGSGKGPSKFSRSLSLMSRAAAPAALALGVGLAKSVKTAADFEQQMSSLGSVSGASGRQMDRFRKQALKAGMDTAFSAREAATAQVELAKGGLSVQNIMSGGLKSALGLAAAGELELGEAASYTANAMNQFGLKGGQSVRVADALATAANATTADVGDFGMALTQGGGAAKAAGMSFRQTVLALEAMAKSGVKNSDAGTSLKAALVQLAAPTNKQKSLMDQLNLSFFDSEGKMRPLADVSRMLGDRLSGMGEQQRLATLKTLAGTDGFRTLLALYDAGPAKLSKWEQGLAKEGSAAAVAAKKQDNLKGKLEQLGGAWETISIIVGSAVIPTLARGAGALTNFLGGMVQGTGAGGRFRDTMRGVGQIVAGFVVPLGQVVLGVGKVVYAFAQTRAGMVALGAALGGLIGRMAFLGAAWAVTKVMAFVSAIKAAVVAVKALSIATISTGIGMLAVVIGTVVGAMMGMDAATGKSKGAFTSLSGAIDKAKGALDRYRGATDALKDTKLAHRTATFNLTDAEARLLAMRRSGTASARDIKRAEHEVALAKRETTRTAQDQRDAEARVGGETRRAVAEQRKSLGTMANVAASGRKQIGTLRGQVQAQKAAGGSSVQLRAAEDILEKGTKRVSSTTKNFREQLRLLRAGAIPAAGQMGILQGVLRKLEARGLGASKEAQALRGQIKQLRSKNVKLGVKVKINIPDINPFGPMGGTGGSGMPADTNLAGGIDKYVKGGVTKKVKEAWKKSPQSRGAGPMGSPGMKGGGAGVDQFNDDAARFGHVITSGFRPGDDGLHGVNRARDYAGGNMMAFAKHMFSRFGGKLLELIYTPMGTGIKNGQAVNIPSFFGSAVAADHHDHVHVAARHGGRANGGPKRATRPTMVEYAEEGPTHPEYYIPTNPRYRRRSIELIQQAAGEIGGPARNLEHFKRGGFKPGRLGIGKLYKRFREHGLGQPGFQMSENAVRRVFEAVGASPREAKRFAGISKGESNRHPGIRGDDPGGTKGWGLVQNTPGVWSKGSKTYKLMQKLGGIGALRNPFKNARVARSLLREGGWGQWYGDQFAQDDPNAKSALTRGDKRWMRGQGGRGRGGSGGGGGDSGPTRAERRQSRRERRERRIARTPVGGRYRRTPAEKLERSRNLLTKAEGTEGTEDDLAAIDTIQGQLRKQAAAMRKRLREVTKALKGKLKPAVRKRLLGERSTLTGELGSNLSDRIGMRDQRTQIGTDRAAAEAERAEAEADARQRRVDALRGLRDQLADLASQAASAWRAGIEQGIDATLAGKLRAIAGGADSQALNAIQGRQSGREDAQNTRDLERAQRRLDSARAAGSSPQRLAELEGAVDEVQGRILEKRIAAQSDAAGKEADAAKEGLDQQEAHLAASLGNQLSGLHGNLEQRKIAYAAFAAQVRAILGPFGQGFEGSPDDAAAINGGGGGGGTGTMKSVPSRREQEVRAALMDHGPNWDQRDRLMAELSRLRKARGLARGGTAGIDPVWVGEQGPELVKLPVGSRVHSVEQSQKMAGGVNIEQVTINTTGPGSHERIASRLAFKVLNA